MLSGVGLHEKKKNSAHALVLAGVWKAKVEGYKLISLNFLARFSIGNIISIYFFVFGLKYTGKK